MTVSFRRMAYLGLLGLALCAAVPFYLAGQQPDSEAVRKLESQVAANPDDVGARTQLLEEHYFLRADRSTKAMAARQQHILWLIRNRPDAPVLDTPYAHLDAILESSAYAEGKQAWMEQVDRDPTNAAILGHAAAYFLLHDSAAAEDLYRRAEAAEPQNPKWTRQLGQLYSLGLSGKADEGRQQAAKDALDAYERSLSNMKEAEEREATLPDVAKAALEAGDLAKARSYAEEILKQAGSSGRDNWNYGNMIHHGHLLLGRLALLDGDVATAKEHLLAAGKTPGSPQLNSFGPNMLLAKELLEKGEREAVLEYFKLCGSFWERSELEAWAKDVRASKVPSFGANLDY